MVSHQMEDAKLAYMQHIHGLRTDLEGPIYDELRATYGPTLKAAWDSATFPQHAESTVMLVERREHPNIEFVLHNVMYFASKNRPFSLTIVCCEENEQYIRNLLGKHETTTNFIVPWKTNTHRDIARPEYNTLMKDPEFWAQVQADYILSVQTDCYLRKALPDILWTLDYAAAPWAWKPWVVGGSGLTFRRRQAVIEMCKKGWHRDIAEDEFFAILCAATKRKVLPLEEAEHIFAESRFVSEDPVGVHQWWTYLYQSDEVAFIEKYRKIYMMLAA